MDPRPIHFEYRRPRHYNPTLYIASHSANPRIATKASLPKKMDPNNSPNPDLRIPNK